MSAENITANIRTLRSGARINLLRSSELPPPVAFLSPAELAKHGGFKIEKRRTEWLGGRYAAKTLLRETLRLTLPLREIEISYDGFGRPVWTGGPGGHLISITHSGPYCAAAAKEGPSVFLGLDLEKAEPRVKAWYDDYFHKEELEGAGNNEDKALDLMELATRRWTEKEALLKALGLGLQADPLDIKIGKDIQFSNKALKRYQELGRPGYLLETSRLDPGYYLSTVADLN
ncbi:MAG: hypothetical protein A3J79_09600 [Elusimicrobia bacterium RIFOXYB2_FULL_62_6]|nr:MAG: hypothetical protein A3J79_09600 [Elusimicrobia bacterium RIFOXYB2_FULL_62_6]